MTSTIHQNKKRMVFMNNKRKVLKFGLATSIFAGIMVSPLIVTSCKSNDVDTNQGNIVNSKNDLIEAMNNVKITANENWINSDTVELPVSIDPSFVFNNGGTNTSTKLTYRSLNGLGIPKDHDVFNLSEYRKILLKFQITDLPENALINKAELKAYKYMSGNKEARSWVLYRIKTNRDFNDYTQSDASNPTYVDTNDIIELFECKENDNIVSADITRFVKEIFNGDCSYNYGLAISGEGNQGAGLNMTNTGLAKEFWPTVTIEYTDPEYLGIDSKKAYFDIDMGDAGTAKINLKTGTLSIFQQLLKTPGNNMPLDIQLVYNSNKWADFNMGAGFKLNVMQKFSDNIIDSGYLYDGYGNKKKFDKVTDPENGTYFRDQEGKGLVVTTESSGWQIRTSDGSTALFNSDRNIKEIENVFGQKIVFNYASSKLTSATAGNGQIVYFTYDNNSNLTKISLSNSDLEIILNYDGPHLTSVSVPGKGTTTFTYDSSDKMTAVENPQGQKFLFTHTEGNYKYAKVTSVVVQSTKSQIDGEHSVNKTAEEEERYTVSYIDRTKSKVTNSKQVQKFFHFSDNGDFIASWDDESQGLGGIINYVGQNQSWSLDTTADDLTYKYNSYATVSSTATDYYVLKTFSGSELTGYIGKMVALCGMAKAKSSAKRLFALSARLTCGSQVTWQHAVFDPRMYDWQFSGIAFKVPDNCSKIEIVCNYLGNINSATFKDVFFKPCNATLSENVFYVGNSVLPASDIAHIKFQRQQRYVDLDEEQEWLEWVDDKIDISDLKEYDLKRLMNSISNGITANNGTKVISPVQNVCFVLNSGVTIDGQTQFAYTSPLYTGTKVTSVNGEKFTKTRMVTDTLVGLPTQNYSVEESADKSFATKITNEYNTKNLLIKTTDSRGVVTEYVYANNLTHGNPVQVKTYHQSDPTKYFSQTKAYSGNGDNVTSQQDENGVSSTYVYDDVGLCKSSTDGKGNVLDFCNSKSDLTLKCMCQSASDGRAFIHYGQNVGLMTSLKTSGTDFGFVYDGMTNIKQVKIADSVYLTSSYDKTQNTTTVNYANGYSATTVSDNYGNVTSVKEGDVVKAQNNFIGQYSAKKVSTHIDNYVGTIVNYSYDSYGEEIAAEETENGALVVKTEQTKDDAGKVTVNKAMLGTNYGNAVVKNEYTYDTNKLDPRLTTEKVYVGSAQKAAVGYTYDTFGRITSKKFVQFVY